MKRWTTSIFQETRNKQGFTLIELVITLAISTVVLSMIVTFVVVIARINNNQENYVQTQDTIRTIGQLIDQDIRGSTQQEDSVSGTGTEEDPYVIKKSNTEQTAYYLNDNQLYRNGSFLLGNIVTFGISSDGTLVDIIIEGEYDGKVMTYEQKVYLRR